MHKGFGLNAAVLALLLASSTPGWAQLAQTFVSGVGLDTSPCSRLLPCRTFASAITKTAAGGEINTLDSGDYGPVTITKSINIISEGVLGGVLGTGATGIVVAAGPSDVVLLRGLDIAGGGTGTVGISVIGGATVEIQDCHVFGFATAGVSMSGDQYMRVHVLNSTISANTVGASILGGAAGNQMVLESTSLDHNTAANVAIAGNSSILLLNNSSLLAAPTGISVTSGSPSLLSFGNNRITNSTPALIPYTLK